MGQSPINPLDKDTNVCYNSGVITTRKAIKYRLYPTPAQQTLLEETLATCRDVYNSMLHWRKYDYQLFGKSPTYQEQKRALPLWKERHPQLCCVYSQVLQEVCS